MSLVLVVVVVVVVVAAHLHVDALYANDYLSTSRLDKRNAPLPRAETGVARLRSFIVVRDGAHAAVIAISLDSRRPVPSSR